MTHSQRLKRPASIVCENHPSTAPRLSPEDAGTNVLHSARVPQHFLSAFQVVGHPLGQKPVPHLNFSADLQYLC